MPPLEDILKVILVEDHDALREMMTVVLRAHNCEVLAYPCAESFEGGLGKLSADVFVVDLNLPGENGLSLTKRLRTIYPLVGLVMLTAQSDIEAMVQGYEQGADIYLVKPIADQELLAAVRAVARKKRAHEKILHTLRAEQLVLDRKTLKLIGADGHSVVVTKSESVLLEALASAPEYKLEIWQILELLGIGMDTYAKASLAVRFTRLRKKLQLAGADDHCLEALRNEGYKLCLPLTII
jgi:DNA-binding response OmpR family regulator